MKDNPIQPLAKRRAQAYRKMLNGYGKIARKTLTQGLRPEQVSKRLDNLAENLSRDTGRFIIEAVDEVIFRTVETYEKLHPGEPLSTVRREELSLEIRRDFLLSRYKGKTLDDRISVAERRLKDNLRRELQNLLLEAPGGVKPLINTITGSGYQYGGTAYRWNLRLVLSEMYRAYQYTGKVVLAELGVEQVEWRNSLRHVPKKSIIDGYAEKAYSPNELPDYPYPCNDSFFIPIYKD